MSQDLYIYTTPHEARVQLRLDSGLLLVGTPTEANGRTDAHLLAVPDGTPSQGGLLEVSCEGYADFANRGLVQVPESGRVLFMLDDVHLVPAAVVPPEPPEPVFPTGTPLEIIQAVYAQGSFDLSTKAGCGQFTEACCDALHHSDPMWGHFEKFPGQNRYPDPPPEGKKAHAVDAVQCLAGQYVGGWDIIHDSMSPNATPSFNHAGPPAPEIWFYPA